MNRAVCSTPRRVDQPGAGGESFEHISWDEWFAKLDEPGLAAIVQERKSDGEPSTFVKLVSRDNADGRRSTARRRDLTR